MRLCAGIHIRSGRTVYLTIDDGALTLHDAPPRAVDCHISADPVSFLLVMWGRRNQWRSAAVGDLLVWGRRPRAGIRLRTLIRNP